MRIRIAYLMLCLPLFVVTFLVLGEPLLLDRAGLLWFRDDSLALIGPHWLSVIVRDVTALGSNWILLYFVGFIVLLLTLQKRSWDAVSLLVMTSGGLLFGMGAKYLFERSRPELVPHLIEVYTPSFPSGHATMSMVCFLGIGLVISNNWQSLAARRVLIAMALLTSIIVGISRVMLGVHWPTDVIAGWLIGLIWVLSVHHGCRHYRNNVAA